MSLAEPMLVSNDGLPTAAPEDADGPGVDEGLLAVLRDLSAEEQSLLLGMLGRALKREGARRPLEVVSFIHESLKAAPDFLHGATQEQLEYLKAPSAICTHADAEVLPLPRARPLGEVTLACALEQRRSTHDFAHTPLTLEELGAFLHHSYGVTRFRPAYNLKRYPIRIAPSAGGLQSVDLYLVVNDVASARRGLYYYDPIAHALRLLDEGDMRFKVMHACIAQEWIAHASAVCILAPNLARVGWKYGNRAYRYVHVDTGVLAQNMYLVGTALGLATCAVSGFYDDMIHELIHADERETFAALLFSVGTKSKETSAVEALL